VLGCLAERPGQALSPTAIAKTLDRSAGAVANALRVLAGQGVVAQTQAKPRRYTVATDTDGGQTKVAALNQRSSMTVSAARGALARPRRRASGRLGVPDAPPAYPAQAPPGEPTEELLAMVAHELRRPLTAWATAAGSSGGTRGWIPPPPAPVVGLGSGCTSPGGWPPPITARCRSLIHQVVEVPASSCGCPWRCPLRGLGRHPDRSARPDAPRA
jgi:signal transduction histidine kinase